MDCRIHWELQGTASPLRSELEGIFHGLNISLKKEWKNVCLKNDCLEAINHIKHEVTHNHPLSNIIEDCKTLAKDLKANIVHIPRASNFMTDCMEKIAREMEGLYKEYDKAPEELLRMVDKEMEEDGFYFV